MSSSINRYLASGNLGGDPELRTTQSGMAVMTFSLCVTDRVKNQQTGDWEDRPNWISCTMFGKRAEGLSPYLSKGSKVFIEGKLRYSSWKDEKTGNNRSKVEVIVDEVVLASKGNSGDYSDYGAPDDPVIDTSSSVYDDDDIPF